MAKKKKRKKKTTLPPKPQKDSSSGDLQFDFSNADVFATAAITLGARLRPVVGLEPEDAHKTLRKMGLPTEWADEAADELERLVAESERGPGRPRKSPEEAESHPLRQEVSLAVLQFLMENPGAAYKKTQRHFYSDEFKRFVLDTLMSEDGLCSTMTVRQAACAIEMPVHTLNAWLSQRRKQREDSDQ